MALFFSPPRSAATSIACKQCSRPLTAQRSCRQAFLVCEQCKKQFQVQEYLNVMDKALEEFLERINCDRI